MRTFIPDIEDINETNAHRALWLSETYVSPSEKSWLCWVAQVERLLGHSLDGNQSVDGTAATIIGNDCDVGGAGAIQVLSLNIMYVAGMDMTGFDCTVPVSIAATPGGGTPLRQNLAVWRSALH